jgi:uncharacterized protein (TIGR02145 family)
MRKTCLLPLIPLVLALYSRSQVAQFPQVYNNDMGSSSASNLNIRQTPGGTGNILIPSGFGIGSKIGAVAMGSNNSDPNFYNWAQVCLPSTTGVLSYGYIACDEVYARIDPTNNYVTVTAAPSLNIRPIAGSTTQWVTIGGQNASYGQNSVVALTGTTSLVSGITWYQVYLTTNCSQPTGWLSGQFLSINPSTSDYRTVGGRVCDNASTCNTSGNINGATINISGLGTTHSSGDFYEYKLPTGYSCTITCSHPNYNTSSPSFYSYTGTNHNYTRSFVLSNCTSLSAPTGLTVTSFSTTSVSLSWNSVSGSGITYEVLKNNASCGSSFGSSGLTTTSTSGTVTGLSPSTQYFFVVRATNSCGTSGNSNCINATTQATCSTPPSPSGLSASAISSSQINLSWTDNSNYETDFEIERSTSFGGPFSNIATVNANITNYSNSSGLSPNTTYFYRVRACCNTTCSNYSNAVNATTNASSSPTVNNITFTNVIENHTGIEQNFTLYSGSVTVTNNPIKICADGSTATYIKINVSNTTGIGFRILDENNQPINDNDKYGHLGTPNDFGNNYVEVTYTHPNYMDASGISRTLTLKVTYNGNDINGINFPLEIYRAPILFVHGLWGGITSFKKMNDDFANTSFIPQSLMLKVDYDMGDYKGASRSFAENSFVVYQNINQLLIQTRQNSFSSGKVDIVAHSMGSILSRLYIIDKNPHHYRDDVHKLITIDGPLGGTQSANLLLSPWGDEARTLLEFRGNRTGLGAVENLKVNSAAIASLNSQPNNLHHIPCYSIKNFIPVNNAGAFDGNWDKLLIDFALNERKCDYSIRFGIHNTQELLDYVYYNESGDLIVPLSSQQGGVSRYNSLNYPNVHTATKDDPALIGHVKLKLKQNPNDDNLFERYGFTPVILDHRTALDESFQNPFTCSADRIQSQKIYINSPVNNSNILNNAGINLSIGANTPINNIKCQIFNNETQIFTIDTVCSLLNVNVPILSTACGSYRIIAVGYNNAAFIDLDTIDIVISPTAALDSIRIVPDSLYLPANSRASFNVVGYYNDGITRNISSLPDILYSVSDTLVAQYSTNNVLKGKQIGLTNSSIVYLGKNASIPINVYEGLNWGMAAFSSSENTICNGEAISFQNYSSLGPSSISWKFQGGTPENSTLQNPLVMYSSPGTYSVTLIAMYPGKNDTLEIPNFITVRQKNKTITSGNWNDPSIWSCNTVPSVNDSAVVALGHTIILNSSSQIRKLYVEYGADISLNDSIADFTVGSNSDKTGSVICEGSMVINRGTLKINGNLSLTGTSHFTMKRGNLIIDGNTGQESTSIPDGQHLFNVASSPANFSFSGGTLQFINPPFGANSQTINCSNNFGLLSTVVFGNGVSTIESNNPNGFGGNLLPPQIGKFILDATTENSNRVFKNLTPLIINKECKVKSGKLIQSGLIKLIDSVPAITDIDGNNYPIVTICDQEWTAKNLEVSHYRNGDTIPQVQDPTAWANLTTGAWCYYQNNTANGTVYGKLYNWYAVNDPRGLAPLGWHIPTNAEWTTLIDTCLEGSSVAGSKIKTMGTLLAGTGLWGGTANTSTNSSGFSGVPAGYCFTNGTFANLNAAAFWWSATQSSTSNAWYREVDQETDEVSSSNYSKKLGISARCIKD